MRKPNYASAMKALRNFERAAINASWAGSAHPDDWDEIHTAYEMAEMRMMETLHALTRETQDAK